MAYAKVIRNTDGTITVRVGRKVEHISTSTKSKAEIFEAVKYAAISKGASLSDEALTQVLFQEAVDA
jgi:hypothetical protein